MTHKLFSSFAWRMLAITLALTFGMACIALAQDKAKCTATTKAGARCKISAQQGSALCHIHNASKTKIICGATTKAGTPCKHTVKKAVDKCSQHKG